MARLKIVKLTEKLFWNLKRRYDFVHLSKIRRATKYLFWRAIQYIIWNYKWCCTKTPGYRCITWNIKERRSIKQNRFLILRFGKSLDFKWWTRLEDQTSIFSYGYTSKYIATRSRTRKICSVLYFKRKYPIW